MELGLCPCLTVLKLVERAGLDEQSLAAVRMAKQHEPVRRTGLDAGVQSFLATSGPVMRASSGKVAAMMARAARIPPPVMR